MSEAFAQLAADVSAKTGKPIVMAHHWTHLRGREVLIGLGAKGVLSFEGTENLLLAVRHAFAYRDFRAMPPPSPPLGPAPAVLERWRERLTRPEALDEADSLTLLADFGIANPGFEIAVSAAEAAAAAGRLGLPVALKTATPGIHHKSDVDGVRLGLATVESVTEAYEDVAGRLGPRAIVTPMAQPGIELALGLVHDRQFGPVMMIGAGGTLIELLADRQVALPPLDSPRAKRLIGRLRLRPLLAKHRNRPSADLDKLAAVVAGFSLLAANLGDLIAELDVNPLVVGAGGVLAVDALVLPRTAAKES
jgi:acetate---CoA ligase (ADP-forming)